MGGKLPWLPGTTEKILKEPRLRAYGCLRRDIRMNLKKRWPTLLLPHLARTTHASSDCSDAVRLKTFLRIPPLRCLTGSLPKPVSRPDSAGYLAIPSRSQSPTELGRQSRSFD